MKTRFGVVFFALALGLGGVGCGGGDGGGSGPISTSVPGNKQLGDLTPAERDQLCADLQAWAMSQAVLDDMCNGTAWLATFLQASLDSSATDADLRAACEGLHASCVSEGLTTMCDEVPATCTATVAEYNTCLGDTTQVFAGLPPCSALTRASVTSEIAQLGSQSSAACTALEMKCPDTTAAGR